MRRNDLLVAMASYDAARRCTPTSERAWTGAALARQAANCPSECLQVLDRYGRSCQETYTMLLVRAAACFALDRRSPSLEALDRARELGTGSPEPWLDRARYLLVWGHLQDAERAIDEALALHPASLDARLLRADLAWYAGRPHEALDIALTADIAGPNERTAHAVGFNQLRMGRHGESVSWFDQCVAHAPDWWEGWFLLGVAHYRRLDFRCAHAAFRRALTLNPFVSTVQTGLVKAAFRLWRLREAWRVQCACLARSREAARLAQVRDP